MELLITGGSGFLGQSVISVLKNEYRITTIGIGKADDYTIDLSIDVPKLNNQYDIVLHAAGKAHSVPKTKAEEDAFFQINTEGTKNLCKALEEKPPRAFIFISTVAVYGVECGTGINENQPLKGNTPYALSKIAAEQYLLEWCLKHHVKLSILRPSLIAGKNPPGNLGAMIHGIKTAKYFRIGTGSARKSILMAEDIARLIPYLTVREGIYNVCDNHHPSFSELEELICRQLNIRTPLSIPFWSAKILALIGDLIGSKAPINTAKLEKITKSLTFSNEKAKRELNWKPMNVLENFKIQ